MKSDEKGILSVCLSLSLSLPLQYMYTTTKVYTIVCIKHNLQYSLHIVYIQMGYSKSQGTS